MDTFSITLQLPVSLLDPKVVSLLKFCHQNDISYVFDPDEDWKYNKLHDETIKLLNGTSSSEVVDYLSEAHIDEVEHTEDIRIDPHAVIIGCAGSCRLRYHPLTLARRKGKCFSCAKLEKA